ncbi:MAG: O-antigen ligase family protein [Melioribacteraceae bacterium]|nr:O-antigen ligase family protein [Melioribacteraceae bacterium]
MISLGLTVICVALFITSDKFVRYIIYTLSALYPFSMGDLGPIPAAQVVEWLTPLYLLIIINEMVPLNRIVAAKPLPSFRGTELFLTALLFLLVCAAMSFYKNELMAIDGGPQGTKRVYFRIIVSVFIFITTALSTYVYKDIINFEKLFKTILWVSVGLGIIRLACYFVSFKMPLMTGPFVYNPDATTRFGGTAYRIGGLTEVVGVGLGASVALYMLMRKIDYRALAAFSIFLFMSGGRTIMVGSLFSVGLFFLLFLNKKLIYLILILFLCVIIMVIVIPPEVFQGQVNRFLAMQGGMATQDHERYQSYMIHFNNFRENIFFGKGIVQYTGFLYHVNPKMEEFIRANLLSGGHGSYISILGTFGLFGTLYLFIMVYGGILVSYLKTKKYSVDNVILAAISSFTFIYLTIKSVYYVSSHSGINDLSLFYLVGFVSSIILIEKNR